MKKLTILASALLIVASLFTASAKDNKRPGGPKQLPKKEMCVQLYNFRTLIGNPELYAKNHEEIFKGLKQLGFTGVEAAGYDQGTGKFYGVSPAQFKADVEAAGLKVVSSHTTKPLDEDELKSSDFSKSLKWWDKTIADHKAAGMKYIVTPWATMPKTLKELKVICDYFNAIGKKCKEAGIQYGYHSHSHEFVKIEDKMAYDYMIENTDPNYVFFQMDVYWAVYGHAAPVEYFNKYPGRFKMLHIKDHYEVGQSGMVGFDAIFRNAAVAGLQDYVVEVENFSPGLDWYKSMQISSEYLRRLPAVKRSYSNPNCNNCGACPAGHKQGKANKQGKKGKKQDKKA